MTRGTDPVMSGMVMVSPTYRIVTHRPSVA